MHIVRRTQTRKNGATASYLLLRHGYRGEDGRMNERVLYLAPEAAADYLGLSEQKLRRAGYTPAQRRAILDAAESRRERSEYVPIVVRGKPVLWKDPPRK